MSKEKKFKEDTEYRIYRILHLAKKYGWELERSDGDKFDFKNKKECTLSINYRYLKVATALNHPKWGNTVLERTGELTHNLIESIFRNPRAHMPKKKVQSKYLTPKNI